MLLVGNDEIVCGGKKKAEHHRPFPGPKLLGLDCRQEKGKLVKEKNGLNVRTGFILL